MLYEGEESMAFQWQREISEESALHRRREERRLLDSLMKGDQRAAAH